MQATSATVKGARSTSLHERSQRAVVSQADAALKGAHLIQTEQITWCTAEHKPDADTTVLLSPTKTSAYTALLGINGRKLTQRDAAEFLEDWIEMIKCFKGEPTNGDDVIPPRAAVGALRNLTIESARKLQSEVKSLGASMSAFESVEAKSEQPIPEFVYFKCKPYADLAEREFVLRLGVITDDKPTVVLRIRQLEKHVEEMASELAELVTTSVGTAATVVLGNYARA